MRPRGCGSESGPSNCISKPSSKVPSPRGRIRAAGRQIERGLHKRASRLTAVSVLAFRLGLRVCCRVLYTGCPSERSYKGPRIPPQRIGPRITEMAKEVSKDLAAGTVGGAAQLICGHPFDTIKVKLQSQSMPPRYAGAMDALRQTVAEDGARGLYKGMGAPLATVAAMNAVLFTARGRMEALLRTDPLLPLTVPQQVLCGAGAGVAVSILACPTELVKCRLQAQSVFAVAAETAGIGASGAAAAAAAVKYDGPIDVAARVLRSEGGIRGLFKGFGPTLCREVPGNAVMFGTYEALKQFAAGGRDPSGLGRVALLTAGGIAGAACWVVVYPTDVVKSVIQVDDYRQPRYSGIMDAYRKILAAEGLKGLYKGFGPAIMRSVPANAACFLAYEITRSTLG